MGTTHATAGTAVIRGISTGTREPRLASTLKKRGDNKTVNDLTVLEYKNQRILTTQQLAEAYETDAQVIINNFNRNKERYIPGKHFYLLDGEDLKAFRATNQIDLSLNLNKLYLWTEKGALLHAKSLNTDKAWQVYEMLVENYFTAQKLPALSGLSPQLQLLINMEIGRAHV